jgi:ATP-dependent RNA helicase DeaD
VTVLLHFVTLINYLIVNQFTSLGLREELVKALDDLEIHSPTEIQAKAIPSMLEHNPDFIGLAQTGTGKTAAFLLPLLQLTDPSVRTTQSLIIAPTRELVQQIHAAFVTFKKYMPKISSAVVYGGTPVYKQVTELKKKPPQILIGTPGRIIDLIKRKAINLETCQHLILDEADEMLNMGFQEDVDEILKHTSQEKKIWLFSATMPAAIRNMVKQYMASPIEVRVRSQQRTNENIEHQYILVERHDKLEALKRIIDYIDELYCVIFCKTKMDTQDLADALNRDGYKASAIHGDLSQQQRNQVLGQFKSGVVNILVATDVVARGIDIDDLTHVIHFALPNDREYYTHRSGRTARAGKKGTSLAIVSPSDQYRLRQFESSLKINIAKINVPNRSEVETKRLDGWLDQIAETEITIAEFSEKAVALIESYTKEELLAKIISRELGQSKDVKGKDDLNLTSRARSSSDKKSERRDRDKDRGRDRDRGGRSRDRDRGKSRDRDGDRRGKKDRSGSSSREKPREYSRDRSDRPDRSDRSDRAARPDRSDRDTRDSGKDKGRKNKDFTPIFINLGKVDGIDKGGLVKLICAEGGYSPDDIGQVTLNKRHSIFELKGKKASSVSKDFKKGKYKGRKIDVKVD